MTSIRPFTSDKNAADAFTNAVANRPSLELLDLGGEIDNSSPFEASTYSVLDQDLDAPGAPSFDHAMGLETVGVAVSAATALTMAVLMCARWAWLRRVRQLGSYARVTRDERMADSL